jgi:hypothetical protein
VRARVITRQRLHRALCTHARTHARTRTWRRFTDEAISNTVVFLLYQKSARALATAPPPPLPFVFDVESFCAPDNNTSYGRSSHTSLENAPFLRYPLKLLLFSS